MKNALIKLGALPEDTNDPPSPAPMAGFCSIDRVVRDGK